LVKSNNTASAITATIETNNQSIQHPRVDPDQPMFTGLR
jgi:hypothetical protein